MPNPPRGPREGAPQDTTHRDRVSTIPDRPNNVQQTSEKPNEEVQNHHLLIQKKIRELNQQHPLISVKLWAMVSEILGREFMPAKEVLWQLEGRLHKPEEALAYFEKKLEEGRKFAMEKRARSHIDPALPRASEKLATPLGGYPSIKPNPAQDLRRRVRTLLGGTIADPEKMIITGPEETEKPKK